MLHNLTHRHVTASKPGVGDIIMCRARWPRSAWCIHIRADGDREWLHVQGADRLVHLIQADTADDLRAAIVEAGVPPE